MPGWRSTVASSMTGPTCLRCMRCSKESERAPCGERLMSTQCGKWNFDGRPVDPEYFNRVVNLLSPYGPEGQNFYLTSNVGLGFLAFHATKESRREIQPHLSHSGDLITWDGILDNRKELGEELEASVAEQLTDLSIVAAAWARWGT